MPKLGNVATIKLESFVIGPFFYEKQTIYKQPRWVFYSKPPVTLCARGVSRVFGRLDKKAKHDLEVSTKSIRGAIRIRLNLEPDWRKCISWKRNAGWNHLSVQDSDGIKTLMKKLGFEDEVTLYLKWRKHAN